MFTVIAVLAATKQISGWWLGALLTALCLWSAFFTWRVRRSGLASTVVLADAAVISALALAQQHLVPAVLIKDSTTWMLPLACTSVYILQIALRPWLGLLGAAIVVISYGLGVTLFKRWALRSLTANRSFAARWVNVARARRSNRSVVVPRVDLPCFFGPRLA